AAQDVVAPAPVNAIVPGIAGQLVGISALALGIAMDDVVAAAAADAIGAAAPEQVVVAGTAADHVVAEAAVQPVIAAAAGQAVCADTAPGVAGGTQRQDIVTAAAEQQRQPRAALQRVGAVAPRLGLQLD